MSLQKNYRNIWIYLLHLLIYSLDIQYIILSKSSLLQHNFMLFIMIINLLALIKLCFVNPGYVFKKFKNLNQESVVKFTKNTERKIYFNDNRWLLLIKIQDQEKIYKYCEECNIFKVEKISHCRECNCCVHEMDHHCFWLRRCVARNTIKYFYFYIFSITFFLHYLMLTFKTVIVLIDTSKSIIFKLIFCLSGICFIFTLFIYMLLCIYSIYYIYLALTNISSREFIKNIIRYRKIDIKQCILRIFQNQKQIICEPVQI
ncbi:dhhc-type zinc finger domain-containing protein [Vairimorpha ceranae]|uniref:Palmitoyltransferase n=1 Tax=Vairimorpha ceranae TaxID=40302 RepID=A0A0F9ZH21_9MICR|nr:dhhc-type zinc finger domain-containing protein [Vairimorpha ceranae]KKO76569.1 dhhc-type zinc finger domain-containing protein [Vairimorpha ceranae]